MFFPLNKKTDKIERGIIHNARANFTVVAIFKASFEYLAPLQLGHSISTSGKNCTSRLMLPVPSHSLHLKFPVL